MGKMLKKNYLRRGGARRPILAVSLVATLAAFGCTTNYTPGNGAPSRSVQDRSLAPASAPIGSESSILPVPMTSSSTRVEALPAPSAKLVKRDPDRAAAILTGGAPARGRYLGSVNPGTSARGYVSDLTPSNRLENPAMYTNPQLTVNSSITSAPTPVIGSGGGGVGSAGGVLVTSGLSGAAVVAGTGTTATTAATTTAATLSPTAAALGLPAGTFASAAPSPTAVSAIAPSAMAPVTTTAVTTTGTRLGTAATTGTTTTSTATTSNAFASGVRPAVSSGTVRLVRPANGTVTMTNVDGQH